MDNRRLIELAAGKWEILVVPEANGSPRPLYFDRPQIDPKIFNPASMGDSVAHREARPDRRHKSAAGLRQNCANVCEHLRHAADGAGQTLSHRVHRRMNVPDTGFTAVEET
jgi:hypothetical protein